MENLLEFYFIFLNQLYRKYELFEKKIMTSNTTGIRR